MQAKILYVILSASQLKSATFDSFVSAAAKAGLKIHTLVIEETVLESLKDMSIEPQSLLYRISIKPKASTIESILLAEHADKFVTIYNPRVIAGPKRKYSEMIEQMAAGLAIIPTKIVDDIWLKDDGLLRQAIGELGGLPILFKTLGLSHGIGVQKLDTVEAVSESVASAIASNQEAILRKYLGDYRHYRLIVVEGKVVAAIEYHKPDDDFRTNAAHTPLVTAVELSSLSLEVIQLAEVSVEYASSILGGVDILVDEHDGNVYLAEVNVPCNFSRAEAPTGINISGLILDAMIRKAQASYK